MKTEEDVYRETQQYIESDKHNRPCTLSSIKKILRTPKIVELIFSRPDVFRLDAEFIHIPHECRSEKILLQFVLGDPKRWSLINEDEQTLPLLIAFEFSKRKYEQISASQWGQWGQRGKKILYPKKSKKYRTYITNLCDIISSKIKDTISRDELVDIIQEYCRSNKVELKPVENYVHKYTEVDINIKKQLLILISGLPDSGKTTFSKMLSGIINKSICFDSDILLEQNIQFESLSSLVKDTNKVIIFSDLNAYRFFKDEEIKDMSVINIIVKPVSIKEMHRQSKYMSHIPFDEYKTNEIDKFNFDIIGDFIVVPNDYTDNLVRELDITIEEISKRLGLNLP